MVIAILTILLIAFGASGALAIGIATNTKSDLELARRVIEHKDERIAYLENTLEVSGPMCLCEHGINFHLEGGRCVSDTDHVREGFITGARKPVPCKCLRYTGPEPLPSFYHPLELK